MGKKFITLWNGEKAPGNELHPASLPMQTEGTTAAEPSPFPASNHGGATSDDFEDILVGLRQAGD